MRFLLDEDVNPSVAEAGRSLKLDVVSVHDVGRRGFGDREQLDYAALQERVLVTRNRDDFIKLTVSRFQASERHEGIVVIPYTFPNKEPGRIARSLKQWNDAHADSVTQYGIFFLGS